MAHREISLPRRLVRALHCSCAGLRAAWMHERSFRLEACVSIVLLPLGLWLGQDQVTRLLLAGTPLLVLAAELLNSALELGIDLACPERNELAGRAKDMASAATFVLMLLVALTWIVLLWPAGRA